MVLYVLLIMVIWIGLMSSMGMRDISGVSIV